jgi:ribose transport system substrate-binding protein
VSAAKAGLTPFTGKPSAFPVTVPLKKPVPAGSKFVYLEAADPIGAMLGKLLKPAVAAVGGKFIVIPAGVTASTAQAAASSAISLKPAVVLVPAFLPNEFGGKLQTLRSEGAKIVGAGMVGWQKYGIQWCVNCVPFNGLVARLLADWVVANKGASANVSFYTVPELSFTSGMWQSFTAQMAKLCPKCAVRSVPIDVSSIGTTAPQTIVNDLQSHSGTNVAVFSTMDMAQGLPAAMSAAGVSNVLTIGAAPSPENLADIKVGKLTAGVAEDLTSLVWTMVDAGAKLAIGQNPQPSENSVPIQLLEQKDITFNPTAGWIGYPDFAKRFATLWHPKR